MAVKAAKNSEQQKVKRQQVLCSMAVVLHIETSHTQAGIANDHHPQLTLSVLMNQHHQHQLTHPQEVVFQFCRVHIQVLGCATPERTLHLFLCSGPGPQVVPVISGRSYDISISQGKRVPTPKGRIKYRHLARNHALGDVPDASCGVDNVEVDVDADSLLDGGLGAGPQACKPPLDLAVYAFHLCWGVHGS